MHGKSKHNMHRNQVPLCGYHDLLYCLSYTSSVCAHNRTRALRYHHNLYNKTGVFDVTVCVFTIPQLGEICRVYVSFFVDLNDSQNGKCARQVYKYRRLSVINEAHIFV